VSYAYNLGQAFEKVVRQIPGNTALWFTPTDQIWYHSLNERASQIARFLLAEGIKKGDVVAIRGEKEPNVYASLLACLKIGAIYVVYDPDSPQPRLDKIFQTCRPKKFLPVARCLDHGRENLTDQNVTGADPAYIMYTSGSTGMPKGAVMTHANLLNFVAWSGEAYGISQRAVLTGLNPLYFDNSVFDTYASLFHGATLVPVSKKCVTDPKWLCKVIDQAGCTIWFSVPSLLIYLDAMKALDGQNFGDIEQFIFGGEGYPKAKLKKLYDAYPDARLFNVYGPTECTCICSSYEIGPEDFEDLQGFPPLGELIDNFDYLVLDEELCLLGPQVGLGYYGDLKRTAQNFVQNPFNSEYKETVYKTGDLVRFEKGALYFVGRADQQIKHMGHRIELGEIEAALCYLDYVSEAAVLYGENRIVAVVSAREDGNVREDLREVLPGYMIPSHFHLVKGPLLKNANGKIDRVRLRETYL
jgi:D-alanine--poly(phosphoribitol) ligase subunit 1